jgi:GT2 family glycosyltransferase
MNDAAVIDQLLDALQRQTRRPDLILIVDNASTDGTLDRAFPENVTIVRNPLNLGTSGAVHIDADSVPEPDVLENLLAFFERLPEAGQEQVCFLGCWPLTSSGEVKVGPITFDGSHLKYLSRSGLGSSTQCDCTLWSGSLYRMAAVARIGLPSADYVLDVGEVEYGYRAGQLGFCSYLVQNCVIHHDVGRKPGSAGRFQGLGSSSFSSNEYVPARCYYLARNWIYFWLYQYTPPRMSHVLRAIGRSFAFTTRFALRPISSRHQLVACMRGIRDGLTMHMERRY